MLELASLAASAVALLASFFQKAGEKAVEKLGESAAGSLYDVLKSKLQPPAAREALADLAQAPDVADAQAALRVALRKALEQDPELARALQGLVAQAATHGQQLDVAGNANKTAQVSGTGNKVNIR
jgi:hypothetical protein